MKTICDYSMIKSGDKVIVGLSGGADSVALLHILVSLSAQLNLDVQAVHINHMLRGGEADRDMDFAEDFCEKYSVPIHIERCDIKSESEKLGKSIEETGRDVRYSIFQKIAGKDGKIATAHTLSDTAETVLLNLARGTGPKGLAGIPPVRDNIIRPLIKCTREEVENYTSENSLKYVTDSSNLSKVYARNKIRLDVIEVLKSINPSFLSNVDRLTEFVQSDEEFFEIQTNKMIKSSEIKSGVYDISKIENLHKSLKSRVLMGILSDFSPQSKHIEFLISAINKKSGAIELPNNGYVKIENGYLKISEKTKKNEISNWQISNLYHGISLADGRKLILQEMPYDEYNEKLKINNLLFNSCLPCDIINSNTILRNRKNGDKFSPTMRNCTKSMKKLFNEKKIPIEKRDKLAMLELNGEILWIESIGISSKISINDTDEKVILISIEEGTDEQQK